MVSSDTVGVAFALDLPEVVVTATGTQQGLKDVAVPVEVLGTAQLEAGAYATLAEVLAEQPGVELAEDHGAGLQMQGLDAAYVLFLVDGKPLIGREAGTFDVSRLGT
jgi:outer membrane receptor for ferrienterochelin and colicins